MADKSKNIIADQCLQPSRSSSGDDTPHALSLSVDWEVYRAYLEDSDLTEEEKQAFIETLWSVIVSFVDLGFGLHPVQQASENCSGQHQDISTAIAENVIISPQDLPNKQADQSADCPWRNSAEKEESCD